jgi:hypothetical protein
MRRFMCFAIVLASSTAHAGQPESIDMVYTELAGSCEQAKLNTEGAPLFYVNSLPLPTYTEAQDSNSPSEWDELTAAFDSTFLHEGANQFRYWIDTVDGSQCTHSRSDVKLIDNRGKTRDLFTNVIRDGNAYDGTTQVSITLAEIDPDLAHELATLKDLLATNESDLIANASKSDALAHELDRMADLESDLDKLLATPFDSLSQAALDALLQEYADVGPEIQAALDALLADLKKDLAEYRQEVAQLVATFAAQAAAVSDGIVTGPARGDGFDPGASGNYVPTSDPSTVPDVPVPQCGPDSFDPTHDPYAAYATSILTQLDGTLFQGKVQDRWTFQSVVKGWRQNQRVVSQALGVRACTSQKEWGAFLGAQVRVTDYLRQYMDQNDWFNDAPIPAELKAFVDGLLLERMANQAWAVKQGLNTWIGPTPTPQQQLIIDTLVAFREGFQDLDAETAEDPATPLTMAKVLDGAAVVIKEVGKLAVYISPVGPFIGLCEVISGREMCWPSGRVLSRGERVFSGATVLFGGVFWKGLGKAFRGISQFACADMAEVERIYFAAKNGAKGFTKINSTTYRSAAGLIYGADPHVESRIVHVLLHGYPNAIKDSHSVFSVAADDLLPLIDEAWASKGALVGVPQQSGNLAYDIAMGRAIGTQGEKTIRIVVVPGTANIVTAHPVL